MTEKPDGLDFEFAYRSDLYEAATIEAFAARLIRFLDHVTADPGLPIGDVGLLTATERRGLVPASGADGSVAGLCRSWGRCRRTPRPRGGGCRRPHRDLSPTRRARGSLARELVRPRRGTRRPGGLCGAALARLGDGGVGDRSHRCSSVMIDPEHPAARIQLMLEASVARTGVTTAEAVVSLPSRVEWVDRRCVGTGVLESRKFTPTTRPTWCSPRARPATPKRSSSRRAASALRDDLAEIFAADADSRVLHVAGPGFDMALLRCCWRVCRALDSWWLPDRPTAGRNSPS
ncbi:hypothetical protein GS448_26245 [Rhodococcus hoagii]|nr:hypothetical protein [Prescottella equi]